MYTIFIEMMEKYTVQISSRSLHLTIKAEINLIFVQKSKIQFLSKWNICHGTKEQSERIFPNGSGENISASIYFDTIVLTNRFPC